MVTKSGSWVYAKNVNEQVNPNTAKRLHWSNTSNAVGNSSKSASAKYTKEKYTAKENGKSVTKYKYNYPYTLTAHDFKLNIPAEAYIKKVTFQVSMRVSNDALVEFPRGLFCIYGSGWDKHIDNTKNKETGWHNGLYLVNPKKKLGTSYSTFSYEMNESDVKKGKFSVSDFNTTKMGIDLIFDDVADANCTVYLKWVRIKVEYEMPKYTLVHNGTDTSQSKPRQIKSGVINKVKFTLKQSTKAKGGTQQLQLTVPYGVKIFTVYPNGGSYNSNTQKWSVNCNGVTEADLEVQYIDYTVNTDKITLGNSNVTKNFYINTVLGTVDDYGETNTQLVTLKPHKRHQTCFKVISKVESNDNTIIFDIDTNTGFDFDNLQCEVIGDLTSNGVNITSVSGSAITFNLDHTANDESPKFDIAFNLCLRPLVTGNCYIDVNVRSGDTSNKCEFKVADPYEYHFGNYSDPTDTAFNFHFISDEIIFTNHRIGSQLATGTYVLPVGVKENDSVMIQSKPTIHMYKHKEVDYIGCVPLEHSHFDPASDYDDTLIDNTYKNGEYVGKKLTPKETIDLNARVHPQDVTTLQGLVDIDKPIPVNTNHKSFEGDALNHRGWAEIYGVKATYTNPHWYKIAVKLKYLTHNLNTRFKIKKGSKTFDYAIPRTVAPVFTSGDPLSQDQSTDFFLVDTDGGYVYVEDETVIVDYLDENDDEVVFTDSDENNELIANLEAEGYVVVEPTLNENIQIILDTGDDERFKNQFTIDEGQHITIKSREKLASIVSIGLEWTSSKLDEIKENAISRVVRLIDANDNNSVFEYEYTDFDFTNYNVTDESGSISCHVIGRKRINNDFIEVINQRIDILIDVESGSVVEIDTEDYFDDDNIQFYGSTLTFHLNGNKLSVEDTGFNGKEIQVNNIELEGASYYYEANWVNNNTDAEDSDIFAFFNLQVDENILESKYAHLYDSIYISPFPVADKELLFTRQSEEGILYYYKDDGEEFSYLIDPFYQYFNGVDLKSDNQVSILSLKYGYKTIYLQNGLIRLGINRLNGEMYLAKYDIISKEYITTHRFHLTSYDDVNINSISDDKIELQASNTIISMYRGHPYVIFNHPLEDITIDSKFIRIWGESVDDDVSELPVYFDLLNHENLLPECVGSIDRLSKDCIEVFEDDQEQVEETNIYVSASETEINVGDSVTFSVYDGDEVIVEGEELESLIDYIYSFNKEDVYEVTAVYLGDDNHAYCVSDPIFVTVTQDDVTISDTTTPADPSTLTGNYNLSISSASKFVYKDGKEIKLRLTRGGQGVAGKTIETVRFGSGIATSTTDSKGYVTFKNTDKSSVPNSYKIGARFFEHGKLITSKFKTVKLEKGTTHWSLNHYANTKGNYVSFNLKDSFNHNIVNQKVVIYINGTKYNKKTNSNGNVNIKMNNKGRYKYKCSFAGNKYYKKSTKSFGENIKG